MSVLFVSGKQINLPAALELFLDRLYFLYVPDGKGSNQKKDKSKKYMVYMRSVLLIFLGACLVCSITNGHVRDRDRSSIEECCIV